MRDEAYGALLTAVGGDGSYSWAVTGGALPSGLMLEGSSGLITGAPRVIGDSNFTVQVSSGDGQTEIQELTLGVLAPPLLEPGARCSDAGGSALVSFEDPNLESAVRAALSLGAGDSLTCDVAATLLFLTNGGGRGITSVVGAQNLSKLSDVDLRENSISDTGPLSGLNDLYSLNLFSNAIADIGPLAGLTTLGRLNLWDNPFTDLSPLSGLTNLEYLELWGNPTPITDISPLSGLTTLYDLFVENNAISDVSALGGMINLIRLDLDRNNLTDLSPLEGLTSLERLWLAGNSSLSDIQPLLDNLGLGAGDGVDLRATSVSCADIDALKAKGVSVSSDCP